MKNNEELDLLALRYLHGNASPEEVARVDALVRRDPAFALALARSAALDSALRGTLAVDRDVRRLAPRAPRPPGLAWTAAAAVIALAAGAWFLLRAEESKPRAAPRPVPVAVKPSTPAAPPAPEPPAPVEPPKPVPTSTPEPMPVEPPAGPPETPPMPEPEEEAPEPEPAPGEPESPPTPPAKPTERAAAFAWIESTGAELRDGDGLAVPKGAAVRVRFADKSWLDASSETRVTRMVSHGPKGTGKRVEIETGALDLDVVRQVYKHPFVILTPHAEVTVLGTRLRVAVSKDATRVDVDKGRVRLTRRSDGKSVELRSGTLATAQEGAPFEAAREVPRVVEDHEAGGSKWSFGEWSARSLYGVSIEGGRRTFKIVYLPNEDDKERYTQFRLPAKLAPETDRAVSFQLRAVDFDPEADYRVEMREADGDVWLVGGAKLRTLKEGWNAMELPLPRQPANSWGGGDKKFDPAGVVEFYFSLATARGTVFIDDWTLVSVVPVMK